MCAIISPLAAAGSYGQQYFHYSLLHTIEDGFGLGPYLGNANAVSAYRQHLARARRLTARSCLATSHSAATRPAV